MGNSRALYLFFGVLATIAFYFLIAQLDKPEPQQLETGDFYRYVDEDIGVVCYVLTSQQAMSCLWLEDEPR